MIIRTFVALEIDKSAIDVLLSQRDELWANSGKVKWESEEKLHLTLKFIGDINEKKLPQICEDLGHLYSKIDKFTLRFTKFGLFFRNNLPTILWAGLEKNSELIYLQNKTETVLSEHDIPVDKRSFKPHLTLLRIKGYENLKAIKSFEKCKINTPEFTAENIVLFKSELNPGGSVYTPLQKFEL